VCLSVTGEKVRKLSKDDQAKFLKSIASELGKKNIAQDINSYRDAPPGFRFWCGPTIEPDDIKDALAEMEKVYHQKIKEL
jgi:phosphoserine aminotransferase